MLYVILYLVAIVIANLTVAQFGAFTTAGDVVIPVSALTSFALISVNLTTRDRLHDAWQHRHLWLRMAALIASGSVLSALLNLNAVPIAVASLAAFAAAALVDTVVYQLMQRANRRLRMNTSNLFSAAVDSVVFPLLAFGWPLLPEVFAAEFIAKFAGGIIWVYVLTLNVKDNKAVQYV